MKTILLILAFVLSTNSYAIDYCDHENPFPAIGDYLVELYRDYQKYTCSPSLFPFSLGEGFTQEQRCMLLSDLEILKSLSFNQYGEKFEEIFNPTSSPELAGVELYHWLIARISKVHVMESKVSLAINYGLCAEQDNICHETYERGEIGLSTSYFNKQNSVDRLITLLHEARHTDGHDFVNGDNSSSVGHDTLHVDCENTTVYVGESNHQDRGKVCDNDFNGANGLEIVLLGNFLENCSDCKDLTVFDDPGLEKFYLRNLYNSNLQEINFKNIDLSKTIQ